MSDKLQNSIFVEQVIGWITQNNSSKKSFGNWDKHISSSGGSEENSEQGDEGELSDLSGIGNNTLDGTVPNTSPITTEDIQQAINDAEQMEKYNTDNKGVGSKAGSLYRKLINNHKKITQPWKTILKRFITQICYQRSFAKINSRMAGARLVSPTLQKLQKYNEVIVAVDVSGSMDESTLERIANEINALSKLSFISTVRLLHWDATVQSDMIIKKGKVLKTNNGSTHFNFTGGGGTNIDCVYNYIIEQNIKPTGVCYITDGYVSGNKFYSKHNCANVVMITKCGGNTILKSIAKQYGQKTIQLFQTDL